MTKTKAGADAPAQGQPVTEVTASTAQVEEQPQEGGSFVRNADGTLTREEEA